MIPKEISTDTVADTTTRKPTELNQLQRDALALLDEIEKYRKLKGYSLDTLKEVTDISKVMLTRLRNTISGEGESMKEKALITVRLRLDAAKNKEVIA